MLLIVSMATKTNDNEPDTWTSIGRQAAMILNKLRLAAQLNFDEQQNENREGDTDASGADEQREKHQRENIFQDVNKRAPQVRQVELRGRK
jgi:hypothetical protein